MKLRIASRRSSLALIQVNKAVEALRHADESLDVEPVLLNSVGDDLQDVPIEEMKGQGLFSSRISEAIADKWADIAVHSAKDMPSSSPEGLTLAAVLPRGNPLDALIGGGLSDLRQGAVVAAGAPRRRAQLAGLRPDLKFADLRGNIQTRIEKAIEFDAIVLSAAALERLKLNPVPMEILPLEKMIPQVGQGVIAIECRSENTELREFLGGIDDHETRVCITAERAFLRELGGDCDFPVGAYARIGKDEIEIMGFAAHSGKMSRHSISVSLEEPLSENPEELGRRLASELLAV